MLARKGLLALSGSTLAPHFLEVNGSERIAERSGSQRKQKRNAAEQKTLHATFTSEMQGFRINFIIYL